MMGTREQEAPSFALHHVFTLERCRSGLLGGYCKNSQYMSSGSWLNAINIASVRHNIV